MHSVLLAIEDAYNCLLDIEDLDGIKNALGPAAEGFVPRYTHIGSFPSDNSI